MVPSIEPGAVQAPPMTNGNGSKSPSNVIPESKLIQLLSALHAHFPELDCGNLRSLIGDYEKLKADHEITQLAYGRNLKAFGQLDAQKNEADQQLEEANKDRSKLRKQVVRERETMQKNAQEKQDSITLLNKKFMAHDEEMKRVIADIKKREEQVTKLDRSIAQKNGELGTANKERNALRAQVQQLTSDLQSQSQKCQEAEQQNAEINSFKEDLSDLEEERKNVTTILSSAFTSAVEIFHATVGGSLSPNDLEPTSWSAIKTRFRSYNIPLPASNSVYARAMRIIAALAMYSEALEQHIFTTTYLSASDEFDKALSALANEDYEQDVHVRASLLKALPEQQIRIRDVRVEKLVEAMMFGLTGLVPGDAASALEKRLRTLTGKIAADWQRVQRLDERVELHRDITLAGKSSFKALPSVLPHTSEVGASGSSPIDQQRNGKHAQTSQQPDAVIQRSTDILTVVWPAFIPADPEFALILHGYVLTRSHVEAAAKEVADEEEGEDARKQMRKLARSNTAGGQKKSRRDSASFLSKAAPAGSGAV